MPAFHADCHANSLISFRDAAVRLIFRLFSASADIFAPPNSGTRSDYALFIAL